MYIQYGHQGVKEPMADIRQFKMAREGRTHALGSQRGRTAIRRAGGVQAGPGDVNQGSRAHARHFERSREGRVGADGAGGGNRGYEHGPGRPLSIQRARSCRWVVPGVGKRRAVISGRHVIARDGVQQAQ